MPSTQVLLNVSAKHRRDIKPYFETVHYEEHKLFRLRSLQQPGAVKSHFGTTTEDGMASV